MSDVMIEIPLWVILLLGTGVTAPFALIPAFLLRLWAGPVRARLGAGAGVVMAGGTLLFLATGTEEEVLFLGLATLPCLGLNALLAWGDNWWIEPLGFGMLVIAMAGLALAVAVAG